MLLGGGDVDSDEHGATEQHPKLYNIDRTTDSVDIELMNQATERQLPILAICRGMHIVNVARGSTLIQHLEPSSVLHRGSGAEAMVDHEVAIAPASQLAELHGENAMTIRSGHHQAVDVIGADLMRPVGCPRVPRTPERSRGVAPPIMIFSPMTSRSILAPDAKARRTL